MKRIVRAPEKINRISKFVFTLLIICIMLAGCQQEEEINRNLGVEETEVDIPLGFAPAELTVDEAPTSRNFISENTAGFCLHSAASSSGLKTRAVTRFSNTWVLVFASDGTCRTCRNIGESSIGIPIAARVPTEKDMTIYILCNGPDVLASPSNLQAFEGSAYFSTANYSDEGTIPYIGKISGASINNNGKLVDASGTVVQSFSLKRMAAKVSITCSVVIPDYRITAVQLYNAPAKMYYNYGNMSAEISSTPLEAGVVSGSTYTWFVGENLRGNGGSTNQNERYADKAPVSSTYIKVTLQSTIGVESVSYTIYPGKNLSDNYDLARNWDYVYTTTFAKTGAEVSSDKRVSATGIPVNLTGVPSNCYVMSPGQSYKFNPRIKGEGQNETGGVNISITHEVDEIKLVWQDAQSLVQKLGLSGDHTYAVVSLNANVAGNAVIAASLGGKIVWSWHLWVRKERLDIYSYNVSQTFLACNLGALNWANEDTKKYGANSLGLIYQWGRNIPFPGASAVNSNTIRPVYDINNNLVSLAASQGVQNVSDAIASPTVFIYADAGASWHVDGDDLWGGRTHVKTIFDPSPREWKVTSGDSAWNDWTTDGSSEKTFPWSSDPPARTLRLSALFPAAGFYTGSPAGSPALTNVGTIGRYWNDTSDDNKARVLAFDNSMVDRISIDQSYGCSIRPVKILTGANQ